MDNLYLILNLGSLSIPFLFSFHPKLKLYKKWGAIFMGIALMMLIFLPWDIWFTKAGYWGFNPAYYLDYTFLGLPMEEWLFFICIPYACVFTHYALLHYFPHMKLDERWTNWISYALLLILILLVNFNYDKWYTLVNFGLAILLIPISLKINRPLLQSYYLTFLVMLIPFFIVNGILTGSFIEDQVVWYNNDENLGIRMFTIPVEDSIYAFSMILIPLLVSEGKRKNAALNSGGA